MDGDVCHVLAILAGPGFEFDREALSFDRLLPAAALAMAEESERGLLKEGHVSPGSPLLVCEFKRDRQVWLSSADSLHKAADEVVDRARRMVSSIDWWPKRRLRLTFLRHQFEHLPAHLVMALRCFPGVDVHLEDPAGAAKLFGPILPAGVLEA